MCIELKDTTVVKQQATGFGLLATCAVAGRVLVLLSCICLPEPKHFNYIN